ncbi:MAG: tetratricopeptide repeat protein [Bacteroidia bacterium]|nr:tetratricopeptide repeat protein [Bacteroidia bacterium]
MKRLRLLILVFLLLPPLRTAAQEIDSLAVRTIAIEEARQLKNSYKFDQALEILSELLEQDSSDEAVAAEIADCHFQNGAYEDAFPLYVMLSQHNPTKVMYKVRQMLSAYRLKGYEQAVSTGKEILKQDTIPALIALVGDAYNQLEQYDSALVYYNKALTAKPLYESVVSKVSKILLDRKEFDKVIEVTDSLLVLDPDNITVAPIKGVALYRKGEYESAIEVLERQSLIGNDSYGVHFYLGQSYWQTKVMYRAEEELEKAWQTDSSDVNLAMSIAGVKADAFRPFDSEVKPWLDKAAEMLEPDHAALSKLHQQYGLGYYKKQNSWDLAISHYKEAYTHNPKFISALSTVAYCYEQKKDYKTAIDWYKKYIEVAKPGSSGYKFAKESIDHLTAELFMLEGR